MKLNSISKKKKKKEYIFLKLRHKFNEKNMNFFHF